MLSQFRRELKGEIDGPPAGPESVFVRNGDMIDLGFVIQAILGDGEGHYTFGPKANLRFETIGGQHRPMGGATKN